MISSAHLKKIPAFLYVTLYQDFSTFLYIKNSFFIYSDFIPFLSLMRERGVADVGLLGITDEEEKLNRRMCRLDLCPLETK